MIISTPFTWNNGDKEQFGSRCAMHTAAAGADLQHRQRACDA